MRISHVIKIDQWLVAALILSILQGLLRSHTGGKPWEGETK